MKKNTIMLAAALLCISLVGCGGASSGVYDADNWIGIKDADWDLDSTVCDDKAAKRELTEAEQAEAESDAQAAQEAGEVVQEAIELQDTMNTLSGVENAPGMEFLGAGASIIGGLIGGSAEGRKSVAIKEKEFVDCMTESGWMKADS